MNWELFFIVLTRLLALLKTIDFSQSVPSEVSKEIKSAKNLDEVHAAISKLRKKVQS